MSAFAASPTSTCAYAGMATPKKLVNWALDVSFSPFSEATSSDSIATSSLDYINAQLLAHGFSRDKGLSLDGLAKNDSDKVIKCLLGMLSQRIVGIPPPHPLANLSLARMT